jgi:taurine transport system substrate-binding protein
MTKIRLRALLAALALALPAATLPANAADKKVVIAYQTGALPYAVGIAKGDLGKAEGWQVEYRRFNSGAEIFAAIASGDVQIGDVGSSPFAAATSRGLDVKAVYATSASGRDEALVARNGSGIEKLADLRGKRLAAAPVSTDHYQLLATLKHEGIPESEAKVFAIPQPEIVAGWNRGDIDAAFVWDPALGELQKNGKVLVTAADVAKRGAPTFGAFVAKADFAKANPEFIAAFVRDLDRYYRSFASNPADWGPASDNAKQLANLLGGKPEEQAARLNDAVFVPADVQASEAWLGGGAQGGVAKVLLDTARFLKEQKKITAVRDDYAAFADPQFVQATAKLTN